MHRKSWWSEHEKWMDMVKNGETCSIHFLCISFNTFMVHGHPLRLMTGCHLPPSAKLPIASKIPSKARWRLIGWASAWRLWWLEWFSHWKNWYNWWWSLVIPCLLWYFIVSYTNWLIYPNIQVIGPWLSLGDPPFSEIIHMGVSGNEVHPKNWSSI